MCCLPSESAGLTAQAGGGRLSGHGSSLGNPPDSKRTVTAAVCRSCRHATLLPVLSLGHVPLANALVPPDRLGETEPLYPLDLVFCPGCTLVQITETVPPEQLFAKYLYFSSFSDTVLRHVRELVDRLAVERELCSTSLVVEIASNDGYLLQYYRERGVPVLGIEPARNVADVARRERGVRTISEFFGFELAQRLRSEGAHADIIHAHNVLAHVPELNDFVAGIALLLDGRGILVIEVPYVKDLIDRCEYDTIYHEHLSYFSVTALDRLFRAHDLEVQAIERLAIHGGSLRLRVGPRTGVEPPLAVRSMLAAEALWVSQPGFYRSFANRVRRLQASLRSVLLELKAQGKRTAAYGAAAKGTTLLNTLGVPGDILCYVVDRSPHKQGLYLPGLRLPIFPPTKLVEDMPENVLLLAWNLAEEVLTQQAEYRARGGRFIIPVPEVRVV